VELDRHAVVLTLVQRDDLAAIDVVLAHRRAEVRQEGGHRVALGRDALDLEVDAAEVALAARQHKRHGRVAAPREVHAGGHARHDAAVSDLDGHLLDRPGADQPGHPAAGDDVRQR
jgi:hypothetical protein